jgi:hypothetical protein
MTWILIGTAPAVLGWLGGVCREDLHRVGIWHDSELNVVHVHVLRRIRFHDIGGAIMHK